MQFKIFKNKNLIQGVSNASFGSINEKRSVKFLKSLGYKNISPKNLVWAEQVFSSRVHVCLPKDSGKIIKEVDGLISNVPDQILGIISADCVPVLLYDPKQKVVAALHGGRKCLTKGIIKNAIEEMVLNFNSKPKDILVGIGPHIRACHYWLKEKTYQNLKDTKFEKYFIKRKNKVYFDLTKLAFDEFLKSGIKKKNIEDCKICTFCFYKKYFSARKEEEFPGIYKEKNSRFASFIGIEKKTKTAIDRI
ncbi:MAG: peptidoglycan editing factor PgeF [Patescibacteria group bacterium]|nr:peptidoglycan editing factor PgeF [Patescibacteria group bacterium]